MDRESLKKPKSLPHWTGRQIDAAHYLHSVMLHSGPEAVREVVEHVFDADVIKTPITIKDPTDRRKPLDLKGVTALILHIPSRPTGCTLGAEIE